MDGREPREVSGLTTALILDYVEREGGPDAVHRVLVGSGLAGREKELRDEDRWFADRRRVDLFVAAADVLGDPEAAERIGESAIDFKIGQTLKLALRGLGSPRLTYRNIARANAKLNAVHSMTMLDVSYGRTVLRNVPADHIDYHPCDCQYNVGILSCVPRIFGLPRARVSHTVCIGRGADECIYDVSWQERRSPLKWALAGLLILAATALFAASVLPLAALVASVLATVAVRRSVALRGGHTAELEMRIEEQGHAAERMMSSLKDLTAALDLDEVLAKITANAQAAIGGVEFALLIREEDGLRCRSYSRLARSHRQAIERWADRAAIPAEGSITVEDVGQERSLAPLSAGPDRMGALCASPLPGREGEIGLLVAVSSAANGFLPRDVIQLESYAAQAAIALSNARLYEDQQELAIQDPLTGLYNHRHFHETLERELARCRRGGERLGIVMLDLDAFKLVNDREGHAEGDNVLRTVAATLAAACRSSDMAFRVGGDEFALVLPLASAEDAAKTAERAARAVYEADPKARISWGIGAWPHSGPTKDAVLGAADEAMYEMKRDVQIARRSQAEQIPAEPPEGGGADKRDRLASMSRLAVRLAPVLEVGEVAETVVDEMISSFGLSAVDVMRIDGDQLGTVASGGPRVDRHPELRDWSQPLQAGISGRAARTGESVLVEDTAGDPDYVGTEEAVDGRSELATPIRVDGELWGVLNLEHRDPRGFEYDDLLFADTVASACGAAMHRCELYDELEGAFMRTLAVLGDALEAKDSYTADHAREVAELAERVGVRLGMKGEELRNLGYGAVLHDIGKIGVRSEILSKPDRLTEAEYEEVKQHPILGARMLERIPFFAAVHPLVRSSHERWDGRGYPDLLGGEEIPLGARIIAACDAFHAMSSDRPYRRALSPEQVRMELLEGAASQFDPRVIEALMAEIATGAAHSSAGKEPEAAGLPAM